VDTLSEKEKLCPECGTQMIPIGTEVIRTEILFHPASLERVEYLATTYECPECKDSLEPQFIKDEGVLALVPHSYVSSGLAAHVMYAKFINALPFYRQEKDFENQFSVKISRGTMAHWTIFCAQSYFAPVLDYFHRLLVKRQFVAADETPIQVLKEKDRRPQSKSYVWLFRSGDDGLPPIIVYQYHPTRNGDAAAQFFQDASSGTYIMVDGYAGYNKLKRFRRCSCYAHIRRYFIEAIPKGHEKDFTDPAVQGMLYCNKLFEYERSYREKGFSYEQIYKRRLKDQKPVVEAFLAWVDKQNVSKGSRLERAITYVKNQRSYMMTYLEDGHCSISNNMSENSIRPVTVGRRNWLFCDTTDGADASMMVYSLLETARANSLNPQKYLEYLLEARPGKDMSDEELDALAPWNATVQACCVNKSE
jgi:transposase